MVHGRWRCHFLWAKGYWAFVGILFLLPCVRKFPYTVQAQLQPCFQLKRVWIPGIHAPALPPGTTGSWATFTPHWLLVSTKRSFLTKLLLPAQPAGLGGLITTHTFSFSLDKQCWQGPLKCRPCYHCTCFPVLWSLPLPSSLRVFSQTVIFPDWPLLLVKLVCVGFDHNQEPQCILTFWPEAKCGHWNDLPRSSNDDPTDKITSFPLY